MQRENNPTFVKVAVMALLFAALSTVFSGGCATFAIRPDSGRYQKPVTESLTVTGYCNCQECCGWEYNWYGRPVYSSKGKMKGKPKKIGVTSSGTRARPGTIAADTLLYPFGTIIEIPGYGYGRVEDTGGAIKGKHIDAWFSSHKAALHWGKKEIKVKIYLPKKK